MLNLSTSERDFYTNSLYRFEEQQLRRSQKLFYKLFPDEDTPTPDWAGEMIDNDTIFARHKYPKHLAFFEAGSKYPERCFRAANRCITPWTFLETDRGERRSVEVWTEKDARVLSWDGESECAVPPQDGLLVGIEQAFRVVLDSGRFFDCSRRHRVLTIGGWLSLDRLVSLSNGLRCWQRREDYQASCDADGYLGDQPLRQVGGIDLELPPSLGDVQGRAPLVFERTDALASTLRYIHASRRGDRLSTRDDLRRFSALFGILSGPSCAQPVLRMSESNQEFLRLVSGLVVDPERGVLSPVDQLEFAHHDSDRISAHGGSCMPTEMREKLQSERRWYDAQPLGQSVQEWFRDAAHMPIFYPLETPELVGNETIVAIVPIGLQPIVDAHVPGTNCYKAGGVIHHNTGKTFSGGYELCCHLTGIYPEWWVGKRFERPIRAWAAGKTSETTRDIIQTALLGPTKTVMGYKGFAGTGLMPGRSIGGCTWKQGVSDLADIVRIKHEPTGLWSRLGFKSYNQGRDSFEGTAQHVILLDEEPPEDVYGECLIRTATTRGIIMLTFTPLEGVSKVVLEFMPKNERPEDLS